MQLDTQNSIHQIGNFTSLFFESQNQIIATLKLEHANNMKTLQTQMKTLHDERLENMTEVFLSSVFFF